MKPLESNLFQRAVVYGFLIIFMVAIWFIPDSYDPHWIVKAAIDLMFLSMGLDIRCLDWSESKRIEP